MSTPTPSDPESWLFELKHHKCFHDPLVSPSNPFAKPIRIFQTFTNSLIHAIERRDPETLFLLSTLLFTNLYSALPAFESTSFRLWIKYATLKHPHRRKPAQSHLLALVQTQNRGAAFGIEAKLLKAATQLDNWRARVYAPEALVKDPDALYFFRGKNGIREIDAQQGGNTEMICLVCVSAFSATRQAKAALCGHVLCGCCFYVWLRECRGRFTCPMCRACVVCGANECKDHDIHEDRGEPMGMWESLDRVVLGRKGEVLHGIGPELYWKLREHTRRECGMLRWIEEVLRKREMAKRDPMRVRLGKERERIMGRLVEGGG